LAAVEPSKPSGDVRKEKGIGTKLNRTRS
jgi:hypothetical protein